MSREKNFVEENYSPYREYMKFLSQRVIVDSCKGKIWFVRVPVLLFMAYVLIRNIADIDYYGIFNSFDLLMHEAGHFFFMLFGRTLHILGGTITQLLIPTICLVAFLRKADYFGATFSLGWFGENLFGIARYIGDARARVLPLLGGASKENHDWYNLLKNWNILEYDTYIASGVWLTGVTVMIAAILFGTWLLWVMYRDGEVT